MAFKNLYELLKLKPTATPKDIAQAMKNAAQNQTISLDDLKQCKQLLLNEEARKKYDAKWRTIFNEPTEPTEPKLEPKVEPKVEPKTEWEQVEIKDKYNAVDNKSDGISVTFGLICYIGSVIFACLSLYKLFVYKNSEIESLSRNAYVGGDAYNYIINGTHGITYAVLAVLLTLWGSALMGSAKNDIPESV
ncbi:MAG: hypothetical protein J6570_04000 [Snodgrassella sp.]|nr:hypothetical protein [Snodgrassella sp.]